MDFYLTSIIQGLCFSGLALGIYLSMKIFNIPDITTDGSYTLGGALTGVLLSKGMPPGLIFPIVIASGAAAGAATGFIHTRLKVHPLLAGILVMSALYSVNLVVMGRSNIPLLSFTNLFQRARFGGNEVVNALILVVCAAICLIAALGYLLRTDFGIAMRATGNSEGMIRAMGVNTDRMKIIGLALANALTALSGYLMAQYQGFADINMGIGIVITGLGSVVIGETIVKRLAVRKVTLVLGMICGGAILFELALAVALSLGIDPALLKLVTAASVLFMISLTHISFKRLA